MSSDTTAHTLAPSEEAFDIPLSPPPLGDEPGPATGPSGTYPDGTCTRWSNATSRTHHDKRLPSSIPINNSVGTLEYRVIDHLPFKSKNIVVMIF